MIKSLFSINKLLLKRKFFSQLLIYSLLLAILPNLIVSIFSYVSIVSAFRQEASTNSNVLLTRMKSAMEILVEQIRENARQVNYNTAFREFEQFPNGYYYENVSGSIDDNDLVNHYWYLQNKQKAITSINLFRISNSYMDSVYYYDQAKDLILAFNDGNLPRQYEFSLFYDQVWYDDLPQLVDKAVFITNTRHVEHANGSLSHVMTMLIRSNKSENAFIVNLNADAIEKQIIYKLSDRDNLVVLSRTGEPIFNSNSDQSNVELLQLIGKDERLYSEETISFISEEMLVTSSYSPELGWSFINITKLSELKSGLSVLQQQIKAGSLMLVMTATLFAFLSSKRLYRPLQRVMESLTKSEESSSSTHKDEFKGIEDFLHLTLHKKGEITEKLQESLPFYREKFILSLLKPHTMTRADIDTKLRYLGIDFDLEHAICMIVLLNDYHLLSATKEPLIQDVYRLKVIQLLQQTTIPAKKLVVEWQEDKIAIVLTMEKPEKQFTQQWTQQLILNLKDISEGRFTIGVGNISKDITELASSCREALEALHYRFLYNEFHVLHYHDIAAPIHSNDHDEKFKELTDNFMSFLKLGKINDTKDALTSMMNYMKHNRVHYDEARFVFVQLLQALQHSIVSFGSKFEPLLSVDLYQELAQKETIEAVIIWFEELAIQIIETTYEDANDKRPHYITKLLKLIEQDLSQDLSLNTVSTKLSLNPSYVSRLFKQYVGINFLDYVTNKRMEYSKILLETTTQRISDVALNVGYQNAYYFIKVFKEATGITPGEYRKQLNN